MVGKKTCQTYVEISAERNRPERSDPSLNQVFWCCTPREAAVDHHAVEIKTDQFRRITTTEVMDKKQKQKNLSTEHGVEVRLARTPPKSVEEFCELAGTTASELKSVETPCKDDHQF